MMALPLPSGTTLPPPAGMVTVVVWLLTVCHADRAAIRQDDGLAGRNHSAAGSHLNCQAVSVFNARSVFQHHIPCDAALNGNRDAVGDGHGLALSDGQAGTCRDRKVFTGRDGSSINFPISGSFKEDPAPGILSGLIADSCGANHRIAVLACGEGAAVRPRRSAADANVSPATGRRHGAPADSNGSAGSTDTEITSADAAADARAFFAGGLHDPAGNGDHTACSAEVRSRRVRGVSAAADARASVCAGLHGAAGNGDAPAVSGNAAVDAASSAAASAADPGAGIASAYGCNGSSMDFNGAAITGIIPVRLTTAAANAGAPITAQSGNGAAVDGNGSAGTSHAAADAGRALLVRLPLPCRR